MENNKKLSISTPAAIVVAGFLIMLAILINGAGGKSSANTNKTLSEQVGVSKEKLAQCIKDTDAQALQNKIQTSVEAAMKAVPPEQRGTPYSIVIGKNGVRAEIKGADSVDGVKKIIADVRAGKVEAPYQGEVPPLDSSDHVLGNQNGDITIIEYSDFECPYCKAFHSTLTQVLNDDQNVAWSYRHWPIHQNSFAKLEAAECVAKIKGNDAFWKYSTLLFGLLKTAQDPVTDQL